MGLVTDCIWRSPLGLKINAQETAGVMQTADWVKIRGDQLVPATATTICASAPNSGRHTFSTTCP